MYFVLLFIAVGGFINISTFYDFGGLRLTWAPPMFPQGTITHYEVRANGSNAFGPFRTESTEFIASDNGLPPGVYCIHVSCVSLSVYLSMCVYVCVCVRVRVCVWVCVRDCVCVWYVCVVCVCVTIVSLLTTGKSLHQWRPRKLFRLLYIRSEATTWYVSLHPPSVTYVYIYLPCLYPLSRWWWWW